MQKEQIRKQYDLLSLTATETAKNRKLLRNLDRKLLQLNTSFTVLSREIFMLTLSMLHVTIVLFSCLVKRVSLQELFSGQSLV